MNNKLYYFMSVIFLFVGAIIIAIYFEDWRAEKYADAVIKRIDGCTR